MGVVMEPYQEFEKRWAEYHGIEEAVACSTGTAALHLALAALDIGPGDEVIVPEFTMVASANAVAYTGAKPVFVDCDETFNMDVSLIRSKVTKRTKAIMPVHIFGKPCDMDEIMAIAHEYDLYVVEDAAEAHGALYKGKLVGTIGDIGCFSHYKNKIIAAEEGGSCLTRYPELAKRMRSLRSHAFDDDHSYVHTELGFNYRMTNAVAVHLLMQDWDELIAERKNPDGSVNWVGNILLYDNNALMRQSLTTFEKWGYEPRQFFKPMSMQPMFFDPNYINLKAYDYGMRGLYIPWKHRIR